MTFPGKRITSSTEKKMKNGSKQGRLVIQWDKFTSLTGDCMIFGKVELSEKKKKTLSL